MILNHTIITFVLDLGTIKLLNRPNAIRLCKMSSRGMWMVNDKIEVARFISLKTNLTQVPDCIYLWPGKIIPKSKMAGMQLSDLGET